MSSCPQYDVLAVQHDQLGYPQTRLSRDQDQSSIPSRS